MTDQITRALCGAAGGALCAALAWVWTQRLLAQRGHELSLTMTQKYFLGAGIILCGVAIGILTEGVVTETRIQSVAVGEERLAAFALYIIADDLCVLLTQKCHVAPFAEVDLDGNVFILKIDLVYACRLDESFELCQSAVAALAAEICEIYF